tara:strand:- start:314 stop:793 length:480 start_codon:yes stop_codon:yes gene_type:complete
MQEIGNKKYNEKMKKTLFILACFVFTLGTVVAQTDEQKKKIEESTSPKINPELIDQFFNDVHKGSSYKMSADRKKAYLEQLSRFSFVYSPYVENKNHPLLSTIGRRDKYNKNMDYSLDNFKPEEFNFIKYGFNFYLPSSQMIRVDGQDYLIVIKSYKQK